MRKEVVATPLWSVVLAAGLGRRLSSVTDGVPKQFWRDGGRPSLLEQTVARLEPAAARPHMTIVVDRAHAQYASVVPSAGHVFYQPRDRGTAAGVLFGLSPVLQAAPEAVVIVTPSDHGVGRDQRFRSGVLKTAALVRSGAAKVVVFGVVPVAANADYGWITPGAPVSAGRGCPLRTVRGFVEKPPPESAASLFRIGALWNTMLMVAQARAIAQLYAEHLPDVSKLFDTYRRLPAALHAAFLDEAYDTMRTSDFSRDLLAPADGLAVFTWPSSVGWSDLGTPERLERWRQGAEGPVPFSGAA